MGKVCNTTTIGAWLTGRWLGCWVTVVVAFLHLHVEAVGNTCLFVFSWLYPVLFISMNLLFSLR
jgi:hypothetical protein